MTSFLYQPYIKTMLAPGGGGHGSKSVDLTDTTTDVISLVLVDNAYADTNEADDYYDDITGTAIVSGSATAISTPTLTSGTSGVKWDAADFNSGGAGSLTGVGDGVDAVDVIVIWVNVSGGSSATDILVAYIDTGTGFGVIPNSSTVDIVWHADGIINFNYI